MSNQPLYSAETPADAQRPLLSKIKSLMVFRLVVATFLLGSAISFQVINADTEVNSIYKVITILLYLFSLIYAALLERIQNLTTFAYVQFAMDVLLVSLAILFAADVNTPVVTLYPLIIISASYLLFTPGAFIVATFSGIFYGGAVADRIWQLYIGASRPPMLDVITSYVSPFTLNLFSFYLVAFLSSYLTEQLRQTRQALLTEQSNLRELEEFNRKIVENINAGLLTLDSRGRITFLNRAAQELTGYAPDELLGVNIDQLFPSTSSYLTEIELDDAGVLRPSRWDRRFTRRDKQRLYLGLSTSPLRNQDGREVGKILIFEDLTRIKKLEEKTRRDDRLKAVGRLAAGIAHEIRNPLASISGSIQMLRAELELEDENRALMDIVIRETDRLNGLITDFLSYVRPTEIERVPVDLEQLIQELLQTVRHHPRCVASIQLESRIEHTLSVEGDAGQLRQVLWNLVMNALEVMPEGGTLEISTRDLSSAADEPQPRVEICVSDTGSGIDPAIIDRIFDPFFSTKAAGTGLGLAIVEKIIQQHDGLVRARPGKVKGTNFEVVLPSTGSTQRSARAEDTP